RRARLEVGRRVVAEVAVDGRHLDAVAERRTRAHEPRFERAGRRAAVARQVVAVVARFAGQHDAVAALAAAGAGRAARWAGRLGHAGRGAAVVRHRVAVVAALGAFLLAVATLRRVAIADRA